MCKYKPTNDYVFGRIFGQEKNKDLLKDLLESILPDISIQNIKIIKQAHLEKEQMEDKLGVMDILATINDGTKVNVEIQVKDYYNTVERSVFYEAGMYHEGINKSEDYAQIPRTISIWILNYDLFDEGPFHEIARMRRDYENKLLTEKMEIHYLQLPKFRKKCKRISSKLEQWLYFIINENVEEIRLMDDKNIQKAQEELERINADEQERRLAELRMKYIRDTTSLKNGARREGLEKGLERGKKIGRDEGIREEKIHNAKKMLEKNIPVETIIEITGLTKEEIENL